MTISAYVEHLIDAEVAAEEELDSLALEGLNSGEINNRGQVVGVSDLAGDKTYHAFLWAENMRILDLQTLPGDFASAGLGINDRGEAVGVSLDADFNPRAFLWRGGRMLDLNQLAPGSPLYLLIAHSINSRGEIVGFGIDDVGDVHAFSATHAIVTRVMNSAAKPIENLLPPNGRGQSLRPSAR